MLSTVSGSQYGVGLITLLVASSIGIGYYQMFYLPEQLATPDIDEHVLHPVKSTHIEMILGSSNADQQDNYVPKLVNLQLQAALEGKTFDSNQFLLTMQPKA